jgi:hypothetical protein
MSHDARGSPVSMNEAELGLGRFRPGKPPGAGARDHPQAARAPARAC